jgi:hypothetical protein
VDSTDSLNPTAAKSFAEFERLVPEAKIDPERAPKRKKQTDAFVKKMALVPDDERRFMASVIRRAIKLGAPRVSVDANDIRNAFKIGAGKIKAMGEALSRYGVGTLDETGTKDGDKYHVMIGDPADHLTWLDINEFCETSGHDLDEFVFRLRFGLLDGK